MTVTFYVPGPLRPYTEGRSQVEVNVSASTVAEALAALWLAYPGLRDRILTEQGEVRQHVNIFVGEESIRDHGWLAAPVRKGAAITIVPAVSGG
jgi:molybdopterin synthase sulfur carrier subunit